ncbi:hypothetical protein AB0G97_09110 [Streptomyces sp. NPDC020755]|uniref:hypothetical protein n=1 Tax=Streptomyces sp. NPDC020755 TaxID=3154790 RepID=UPI0033CC0CB6
MNLHTQITGAILGVLPGATLDARVTVEQPLQTGRSTWTATVDGLADWIADGIEGKDTLPGGSTPTISARDARSTVLVAIARALREQPTAARLLDGLDELGEAVVQADLDEIATWADALASLAHIHDALGAATAQPAAAHTDYRAEHKTIPLGTYTTPEAAQQHCEAVVSDEYPADATVTFDWLRAKDVGDLATAELVVHLADGDSVATGYVVVPIAVAAAYDADAE